MNHSYFEHLYEHIVGSLSTVGGAWKFPYHNFFASTGY